jgi:KDO2-lipid IV(A) lauroyltransferase
VIDSFYLLIFKVFRFIILYTPRFIQKAIIDLLVLIAYTFNKKHRKIIDTNLNFAYDGALDKEQKDAITKRCYKNLINLMVDFVKNQGISKEDINKKVEFKNTHYIEELIKNNEKIIILTAHYGNWELLALALSANFKSMSVVGRTLDSAVMQQILKANREQFGIDLIDKKGGMIKMVKTLKRGNMLGLLVDQNQATDEGVLVDFFGKETRHTTGATMLAQKFDAVLLPTYITSDDYEKYTITFYEPIRAENSGDKEKDIQNLTQKQATMTEDIIKKNPYEWFWFHKRWKNQYEEIYK